MRNSDKFFIGLILILIGLAIVGFANLPGQGGNDEQARELAALNYCVYDAGEIAGVHEDPTRTTADCVAEILDHWSIAEGR